jgi:carboxypeptidase Taq
LLDGQLVVVDLPDAWNDKYREYLGIEPETNTEGVLQDIHWSGGAIGYFPTYSLGNLYAAQLFEAADRDLGGLDDIFRQGDFVPLKEWLGEKVHQQGRRHRAAELVRQISGTEVSHKPLMTALRRKLGPLYGLS